MDPIQRALSKSFHENANDGRGALSRLKERWTRRSISCAKVKKEVGGEEPPKSPPSSSTYVDGSFSLHSFGKAKRKKWP